MALQEEMEKQGLWLFRYRSSLPILLLAAGLFYYLWSKVHHLRPFPENSRSEEWFLYACMSVSFLGLLMRIYIVGHTPVNTSGRNTSEGQVADTINQTGMYSMVRHPLYVGNFIMWLGIALFTASIWFVLLFIAIYWLYYERIMYAEEQFMRKKFGNAYTDWPRKPRHLFLNFQITKSHHYHLAGRRCLKKKRMDLLQYLLYSYFFMQPGN